MFPFPITIFASVVPGKSFLACSQKRDNLADIKNAHVDHRCSKPSCRKTTTYVDQLIGSTRPWKYGSSAVEINVGIWKLGERKTDKRNVATAKLATGSL